jgi:NADH-quinone oxidoreductase subunit A
MWCCARRLGEGAVPDQVLLVAIVFILVDIEVVFLWSWMTVFKGADMAFKVFSFFEMLIYMATWVIGYVYAIRVGAIDWDETTSLDPAKLAASPMELPTIATTPTMEPAGGHS